MVCFSLCRKVLICEYRTVTTTRRGGREKMTWNKQRIGMGSQPIALRFKFPVPRSPFPVPRSPFPVLHFRLPVPCYLLPFGRLCIIIANKIYVGILDKETLIVSLKALAYKQEPSKSTLRGPHVAQKKLKGLYMDLFLYKPFKKVTWAKTYLGAQVVESLQFFCDSGLVCFEQESTEAGVSSSERTQCTSLVEIPS